MKNLYLLLLLILCIAKTQAQITGDNYPVQAHVFVSGAGSLKLSDYFTSSTKLGVDLILKDLTKSSLDVYLSWEIEGLGLGIQAGSSPGFVPGSFIGLNRGSIRKLSGIDLRAYFQPGVVVGAGVSEAAIFSGSLPEGFYVLRVRAYEAGTGREVSNRAETYFSVAYALPPVLNQPLMGSEVTVTRPQNVPLQWTPRHTSTGSNLISYQIKVCEVSDDDEPNVEINSRQDCFLVNAQTATSYLLKASDLLTLKPGKRYAWQVQIKDLSESLEFQNTGFSEVAWFRYGKACTAPEGLAVAEIGPNRVNLSWKADLQAIGYKVYYKNATAIEWQTQTTFGTSLSLNALDKKESYSFKISTLCDIDNESPTSPEETWEAEEIDTELQDLIDAVLHPLDQISSTSSSTLNSNNTVVNASSPDLPATKAATETLPNSLADLIPTDPAKIPCASHVKGYENCSDSHDDVKVLGNVPLRSLVVGDPLTIYDMLAIVTEVSGSDGVYSGKALVKLPMLNDMMMAVEFSNVSVIQENPAIRGGCVTNVPANGYFRARTGLSREELKAEEVALINQIRKAQDPGSTYTTLGQQIDQYDQTSQEIAEATAAGESLTTEQKEALLAQTIALNSQMINWLENADELIGGSTAGDVILAQIQALIDQLTANQAAIEAGTSFPSLPNLGSTITGITDQIRNLLNAPPTDTPRIQNLQATNITDHSATLTWQGDKRFAKYIVTLQKPGEGVQVFEVSGEKLELENLTKSSNYNVKIVGYEGNQIVDEYQNGYFTTLNSNFPKPENLNISYLGEGKAKVTWDKNALHLKYKLKYTDKAGQIKYAYPTNNELELAGLASDDNFHVELVAFSKSDEISEPAVTDFESPNICNRFKYLEVSANNILEGESLTITAPNCNSEVSWYANNSLVYVEGQSHTFTPSETTTYKARCTIDDPNYTVGKASCEAITEILVKPKCDGVTASVTPNNPTFGNPALLKVNGCKSDIVWYNDLEKPLFSQDSRIINPDQIGETNYSVSCKNTENKTCWTKLNFNVGIHCNLKYSIQSTGQKSERSSTIVLSGCPTTPSFDYSGGGKAKLTGQGQINSGHWIKFTNINQDLTLNVECGTTCQTTINVPGLPWRRSQDCDDFTLAKISDNPLVIGIKNLGPIPLIQSWSDIPGNYENENEKYKYLTSREIPLPLKETTKYTVTSLGGCTAEIVLPPTPLTDQSLIDCPEFKIVPENPVLPDIVVDNPFLAVSEKLGGFGVIIGGPLWLIDKMVGMVLTPNGSITEKIYLFTNTLTAVNCNGTVSWAFEGEKVGGYFNEINKTLDINKTGTYTATCSETGKTTTVNIIRKVDIETWDNTNQIQAPWNTFPGINDPLNQETNTATPLPQGIDCSKLSVSTDQFVEYDKAAELFATCPSGQIYWKRLQPVLAGDANNVVQSGNSIVVNNIRNFTQYAATCEINNKSVCAKTVNIFVKCDLSVKLLSGNVTVTGCPGGGTLYYFKYNGGNWDLTKDDPSTLKKVECRDANNHLVCMVDNLTLSTPSGRVNGQTDLTANATAETTDCLQPTAKKAAQVFEKLLCDDLFGVYAQPQADGTKKLSPEQARIILESFKNAEKSEEFNTLGFYLPELTDQMVTDFANGNCPAVVTALTQNMAGNIDLSSTETTDALTKVLEQTITEQTKNLDQIKLEELLQDLKEHSTESNFEFKWANYFINSSQITSAFDYNGKSFEVYAKLGPDGSLDLRPTPEGIYQDFNVKVVLGNYCHTEYYLKIAYAGSDQTAIELKAKTYEDFEALLGKLGLTLTTSYKAKLTNKYKTEIQTAGNDCNKLDVIYENIPPYVIEALDKAELFAHLQILAACAISDIGATCNTDEQKAILNIIKGINDKRYLFDNLQTNPDLVVQLYLKLSGESLNKYLSALLELSNQYWTDTEKNTNKHIILGNVPVGTNISPSSPYDICRGLNFIVGTSYSGGQLTFNNCCGRYNWLLFNVGSYENRKDINNFSGSVLEPVKVHYDGKEYAVTYPAIVAAHLAWQQNKGTLTESLLNNLNFLGLNSSLKIILTKGYGKFAKVLATITLSKDIIDIGLNGLSTEGKAQLQRDHPRFMAVWPYVSAGLDVATFSLEQLDDFLKNRKAVADILRKEGKTEAADKLDEMGEAIEDGGGLLNAEGKFIDSKLESDYEKYIERKTREGSVPRERLAWKEVREYWLNDSPMARGNNFNRKAVEEDWYKFHEIYLANGKRLDSYNPIKGEIISRKATNLEDIEFDTFEIYLKEMKDKYAVGTIIRSNKYPDLDGQPLKGKYILEIPDSNLKYNNIQSYIDFAKNKYDIEIRFKPE